MGSSLGDRGIVVLVFLTQRRVRIEIGYGLEGLVPEIVSRILETLVQMKASGVAILLVEQKVKSALKVCGRILLLEDGAIRHEGTARALAADPLPLERYIGVHR